MYGDGARVQGIGSRGVAQAKASGRGLLGIGDKRVWRAEWVRGNFLDWELLGRPSGDRGAPTACLRLFHCRPCSLA